jgi:hypothetical protein
VIGVAAAVVVIGVGLVGVLPRLADTGGDKSTAGIASENNRSAPMPGGGPSESPNLTLGAPPVRSSGTDYDARSLSGLSAPPAAPGPGPKSTQPDGAGPAIKEAPELGLDVPPALQRLAQPDARAACLNAILAEYGGSVSFVDYARYGGAPAMIVLLDGANKAPGRRWVVVVGPNCGTGGAIADQKYSSQVG